MNKFVIQDALQELKTILSAKRDAAPLDSKLREELWVWINVVDCLEEGIIQDDAKAVIGTWEKHVKTRDIGKCFTDDPVKGEEARRLMEVICGETSDYVATVLRGNVFRLRHDPP